VEYKRLAKIGVEVMSRVLRTDKESEVRRSAIFYLMIMNYENALPVLKQSFLTDDDLDVRKEAAWAIKKIGGDNAVESLIREPEISYDEFEEYLKSN